MLLFSGCVVYKSNMRAYANDNRADELLMAAYQDGDTAAFEQLYGRYEQKIYNFLLRRLGNKELCHDLFQEIFLKLHRARHEFDPQHSFSTWLFTIVNNTLKNEFKRLGRLKVRVESLLVESVPSNHNGCIDPECNLVCDERSREIEKALAALPEVQREVILLNKYSGFSYAEIAQITGSSEAAVKQKAHRGFMQLREILQGRLDSPNPNSSILSTQQEVRL